MSKKRRQQMEFSKLHPNVKLRIVIVFFNTLASNMVFPFMTIYFSRAIGLGNASLVLSIAIVCNLIVSLFGGYYADRIGRRKLLLISDVIRIVAFLMLAISNSPWYHSIYVTLVFFMVHSVCSGIYGPASEAMLLDATHTKSERKFMYSILYWSTNLSVAVGGIIGAKLFEKHLFLLFCFLTLSAVVSIIITKIFMTEIYKPDQQSRKKDGYKDLLRNYNIIIKDKRFILFILAGMLMFSLEGHFNNFMALRITEQMPVTRLYPLSWEVSGLELFAYLRTENTVCVILFSILLVKLLKSNNEKVLLLFGLLLFVVGYVTISYSFNPWLLFLAMLISVIGEVIFIPIYQAYLGEIPPSHLRSSYLALNKLSVKLSTLLGTMGIYLYKVTGPVMMTIMVGASGVIGIVVLYYVLPRIYKAKSTSTTTST
ncbi:MFS transporter [Paenibacillus dendritiformis]|uniref:MFS transporter n=1 Tax=Paenibacillus dendritiformis TaxID=130049 RepID=UPI000DAA76B4|nr:MFS transporter [Paenibacillus dendritiformis]PZM67593.1 hypothetical protein DOE73_00365 [Paenibacillus dendritiformis]